MNTPCLLSLVVPVFNEVEAVSLFLQRIDDLFPASDSLKLEILFINDGSTDGTLERLLSLTSSQHHTLKIVDLTRNFGKEAALTAGLTLAQGDAVVPMDVDLQHPPEVIIEMLQGWRAGYDVVLARRLDRQSLFHRRCA